MGGFLVAFWLAHFGWELEREVDGKTPQLEGEPQLILITKQLWAGSDNNTSEMDLDVSGLGMGMDGSLGGVR